MLSKSTPLDDVLKLTPPCSCHACNHGCTVGSGFLVEGDSKKIAEVLNISEVELKEKFLEEVELFNKKILRPKLLRQGKPYGKCIFYDEEKKCTVHKVKP